MTKRKMIELLVSLELHAAEQNGYADALQDALTQLYGQKNKRQIKKLFNDTFQGDEFLLDIAKSNL